MTLRVQLAVQGGGAKLCGLLAALEAAQRLEREGVIEVTRLAGTSAGSIAAALYAANIDLAGIRQRVVDNRDKLLALFPKPAWRHLPKVLIGRPIVDVAPLRKVLGEIFKQHSVHRFGELKKPLIVLTTDVTNGSTYPFEQLEQVVVNAIVESCAIPFYFRAPGRKGDSMLLVDGGICENLPVDALRQFEMQDGMIVGVTFRPGSPGATPNNVLSFSKALLDAAMNNSVRRAQLQLGEDRLLSLNLSVDTFDFDKALQEGMGDTYDLTRRQAEEFFRRLADQARSSRPRIVVESGREPEESATTLQRVADLYNAQHAHVKMRYTEARLIVRVGALSIDQETGKRRPDLLQYRLKFQAESEPLACTAIHVTESPDQEFLGTMRRQVFDKAGRVRRTIDMLGRDSKQPNVRKYLLFLDPIIRPNDPEAPFTLEYSHQIRGLVAPLAETGVDTMVSRTIRAEGTTGRIYLIAMIPDTHPNFGIRRSADTTGKVKGRKLEDDELRLLELPIDPDHYALGWVGEDIEPGQVFAAELYDPNFKQRQ
ncbi:MAG TPA: patatin-like phospholipase family protein [Gemmatimonadaceae bacterium]|jgi:predicted acylesterase/phospholipase RssA